MRTGCVNWRKLMKSEWRVSSTYTCGEISYQVYRLRDVTKTDHTGNREIIGTFDTEANAREFADAMNAKEDEE